MPNPWKSFSVKRLRAASERGRKMAKRRWEIDRERRDALARMDKRDPLRVLPDQITRRIIVIDDESQVAEIVIRKFDSTRLINRKLARVGLTLRRKQPMNLIQ
jgi:hypothetical protein